MQINHNNNQTLPPSIPILEKSYSLEPDMVFGWMPKFSFRGPVPLNFAYNIFDSLIQQLQFSRNYPVVYLGFRPINTLQMHDVFTSLKQYEIDVESLFPNKYKHLVQFYRNLYEKEKQRQFIGMNPKYLNSSLHFDSTFESGNLDIAIKVSEFEYDLFLRVDSNTNGHFSQYYFTVTNLVRGQQYKFNIVNLGKYNKLYEKGMRPYIKSNVFDWQQAGENVSYTPKNIRYPIDSRKGYFCLTFEISTQIQNDTLHIAYCVPYTYSYLNKQLSSLQYQTKSIGSTLSGLSIPYVEFGNPQAKSLIIQARIHPGESNSSWMMHGLLVFFNSLESQFIKEHLHIKIIPMANPDGVILGNYRTSLAGKDLNRQFNQTDEILFPEVQSIKGVMEGAFNKEQKIFGFLDLHGHSTKKNSFLYGPDYSIWETQYLTTRIFPKYLADKTEMFRYHSCLFRVSELKKNTARAIFNQKYDISNCYTIEVSNGFYYISGNPINYEFNVQSWIKMGQYIGQAIHDLLVADINIENHKLLIEERKKYYREKRKKIKEREIHTSKIFEQDKSINNISAFKENASLFEKDEVLKNLFNDIEQKEEERHKQNNEEGSDSDSSDQDYDDKQQKELKKQIQNPQEQLKQQKKEKVKKEGNIFSPNDSQCIKQKSFQKVGSKREKSFISSPKQKLELSVAYEFKQNQLQSPPSGLIQQNVLCQKQKNMNQSNILSSFLASQHFQMSESPNRQIELKDIQNNILNLSRVFHRKERPQKNQYFKKLITYFSANRKSLSQNETKNQLQISAIVIKELPDSDSRCQSDKMNWKNKKSNSFVNKWGNRNTILQDFEIDNKQVLVKKLAKMTESRVFGQKKEENGEMKSIANFFQK